MTGRGDNFTIRLATGVDIPALLLLIDKSVRILQRADYSAEQLDAALGTAYGVDTQLIADETYYVVEAVGAAGERVLAASGGWSMRKTLYGSDHGPYRDNALLDPARDAAKMRPVLSSEKKSAGDVTPALVRAKPSMASWLP